MKYSSQQQNSLQTILTTTHVRHSTQFLCSDNEGWGPISKTRWDLTPCFLDIWLLFVTAFGLVGGAGAIFYLLKKRVPQDVKKNWHYYTKL